MSERRKHRRELRDRLPSGLRGPSRVAAGFRDTACRGPLPHDFSLADMPSTAESQGTSLSNTASVGGGAVRLCQPVRMTSNGRVERRLGLAARNGNCLLIRQRSCLSREVTRSPVASTSSRLGTARQVKRSEARATKTREDQECKETEL